MSEPSESMVRYLELLKRLGPDTPDDDALYDELDAAWYVLSDDEHEEINRRLDIRATE